MAKINVLDKDVMLYSVKTENYISITDIAKYKNPAAPADIVKNWLRSKNTIELLGLWERIHNPDFNYISLRGNAVLRWEYLPGSTVYLVWSQSRDDSDFNSDQLPFEFDEDMNHMFRVFPHDIFLLKLSYRIPI